MPPAVSVRATYDHFSVYFIYLLAVPSVDGTISSAKQLIGNYLKNNSNV